MGFCVFASAWLAMRRRGVGDGQWAFAGHAAGHNGWVMGLALSADGRLLASGSEDGAMRLWETSGACLRTLPIDPRYERPDMALE